MRHLAGTVVGFLACVVATATIAGDESRRPAPKAIVELFTSQGCSSCVKADEYFAEIARRDDVVALSFHVDYWDYLGWRDTFDELDYFRNGGILHYVLRGLAREAA